MRGFARGPGLRLGALIVLALVLTAVGGSAVAARHHHDGSGVYDERCPLQLLAAVDRAGLVVGVATATPVALVAGLAALVPGVRPARRPAADTRLRAPPAR
jgi:hypothetical protein